MNQNNSVTYHTRIVNVGEVAVGGGNPVRIQSMTNTHTLDTQATFEQCVRMIDAGCEMIRITAPGVKEAVNLGLIKMQLRKRGYNHPIIADIHFNPKAAETAAAIVEKVRINPGNYVDRKKRKSVFSTIEYEHLLEKARDSISPLVKICRDHGTVLRIGSNHGSLSDRIMYKYGNTAEGMVYSALEFIEILESLNFYDTIISMKASNVKVMMDANFLLVEEMLKRNMNYPLHLGVTEAGNAEDGRIKSAAGIGPLLVAGIGDTIRVSLTEDPEFEMPVAKKIIHCASKIQQEFSMPIGKLPDFSFSSDQILSRENGPLVLVESKALHGDNISIKADLIYNGEHLESTSEKIKYLVISGKSSQSNIDENVFIILSPKEISLNEIRKFQGKGLLIEVSNHHDFNEAMDILYLLETAQVCIPVIIKRNYKDTVGKTVLIQAAIEFSVIFNRFQLGGMWLEANTLPADILVNYAYGILQGLGKRSTKTEYISCPGCGRTLFDLQQTLEKIKSETGHLAGLKIGVMGCIVNGPGEMADADYGYVGAGPGKVNLFKGQEVILKNIDEAEAVKELINLIKLNSDWWDRPLSEL